MPFPAQSSFIAVIRSQQFALNYNATLSANIHNEFRGGFSRFPASFTDEHTENENARFGICCAAVEQHPEFAQDPLHQVGLVLFQPVGYNLLGGGNIPFQTNSGRLDTMTIADNLLWDVGKHSLKFGVEYRRWDNFRSRIFVNDMGRMSFDGPTGDLWVGDVGWEMREMIHRVERGGNYGWPILEGSQSVRPEVKRGPTPILAPVFEHLHTESLSITGGMVYRGKKLSGLAGAYVYGDYVTGKLWALHRNTATAK